MKPPVFAGGFFMRLATAVNQASHMHENLNSE